MKVKFPRKFKRKIGDLNTKDMDEDNENYFDMDVCRQEMQLFDFEQGIYEKIAGLFGRKLAFSNK